MVGRQLCIAYSLKRSSSKCANIKWVWFLSKPFKGEILDEGQQWVLRLVGIFHEKECECVLKCISVSVGVNEWIYKYEWCQNLSKVKYREEGNKLFQADKCTQVRGWLGFIWCSTLYFLDHFFFNLMLIFP